MKIILSPIILSCFLSTSCWSLPTEYTAIYNAKLKQADGVLSTQLKKNGDIYSFELITEATGFWKAIIKGSIIERSTFAIENDQFKTDKRKTLRICLGGKASTLYKVVFEDSEDQECLSKIIEKVTGGIFTSTAVEFTNTPKHEVSYGLLVDRFGATDLNIKERSFETVLGEDVVVGKSKIGVVSKLNPDNEWRVKDISQLQKFLDYLRSYSKISVKLSNKFKGDLEGKINAELKNGQTRAQDLKKNQQSVEDTESMAEIQKSTSIVEPVFIQGLKELIHQVAFGKIKLK